MARAVQYLRASSGLQACSIEQQEVAIAAYAALRGFDLIDTYSDAAISGLTLKARPALRRLIADVLAPTRRFDVILVYDVSRWGRFQDIDQGAHYEFLCRKAGVAIHYCAEAFENDGSPEANLIKQVRRAMAAEFSRALSKRVRLAKDQVVAKGFVVSAPPFAIQREVIGRDGRARGVLARGEFKASVGLRTRFTPGPPDAVETVRKIFRLYAVTGLSLAALVQQLNAEQAPSPSGAGWTRERLRRVLRNEIYAGVYTYGRRRYRLGVRSTDAEAPPRRTEMALEPIVPRWIFDRAQVLIRLGRRERSDEDMLEDLRDLLKRRGRLDTGLIDNTPSVAKAATYRQRFGSLSAAYNLIGYAGRRAPK
jgi:DNA invertase Pin-like site-specific DNA recombinase